MGQPSSSMSSDLDMYSDDFDSKEKMKLENRSSQEEPEEKLTGINIL